MNTTDFFTSIEDAKNHKNTHSTNSRYKHFTHSHFTAGDEEQFESFRNKKYFENKSTKKIINEIDIPQIYKNLSNLSVTHTFRYIFNKFKKGVFIQIRNNQLSVMLPFSKHNFINEWNHLAHFDTSKYSNWNDIFKKCNTLENRLFNPKNTNSNSKYWYANNGLIRYEYPIKELDSGIPMINHMFQTLCETHSLPDIEFFINKRDYPILKCNYTEPYEMWYENETKLVSHYYDSYIPILSMCTSDGYADIPIPTWNDWALVMISENKYFPKSQIYDNNIPNTSWRDKIPTAVFRGASTGSGYTIDTNKRLYLAYLASFKKLDDDNIPFLDAGITCWNARPRKYGKYVDTIEKENLQLVSFKTFEEQCKYKYIINVEGHVCAYRLSRELCSGSVLLIVDCKYKLWYFDKLKPFVHYIPIKADLSDIYDKIKWCKLNDLKCEQIAQNALKFYLETITKANILNNLHDILWSIKNQTKSYNYPKISFMELQLAKETEMISSLTQNYKFNTENTNNFIVPPYKRSFEFLQGIQLYFYNNNNFTQYFHINKIISQNNNHNIIHHYSDNHNLEIIEKQCPNYTHEAFIGLFCINECLKYSPHFAYTFGIFNNSLFIEYINGKSLFESLQDNSKTLIEWCEICVQICFALCDAQQRFAFVHQDLYPWNIIIKEYSEPIKIYYVIGTEAFLVESKFVPIIIDYGNSHAVINGQHFGKIRPTRTSTIQDVYCFVISSIHEIIKHYCSKEDLSLIFRIMEFLEVKNFKSLKDLKLWINDNKKFSTMIDSDKQENKTPLDFVYYLNKIIKIQFFQKVDLIESTMRQGTSLHVFEYLNGVDNIENILNEMEFRVEKNTKFKYEFIRVVKSLSEIYNFEKKYLNIVDENKLLLNLDEFNDEIDYVFEEIDYDNIENYSIVENKFNNNLIYEIRYFYLHNESDKLKKVNYKQFVYNLHADANNKLLRNTAEKVK